MTAGNLASVDSLDQAEARRAPRRKLFLAALIESEAVTGPARIRDLSETGALLEGASFPPVGAVLELKRQSLRIRGTVVWNTVSRCGLRFDGIISVPDWVAGACSGQGSAQGQARVDDIQAAIRAGVTPAAELAVVASMPANDAPGAEGLDQLIAAELSYVRRLLDDVGAALIEDPVLLRRHAPALQSFDIAGQILGHLGQVMAAGNRAAAVDAIGMHDLRARLTRKRLFGP